MERKHNILRLFCIPLAALVLFCTFAMFCPGQTAHAEAIPEFADYSPIVEPLFYVLIDGQYYSFKLPMISTFMLDPVTKFGASIVRDITNNQVIGGWEFTIDDYINPSKAILSFQSIIGDIEQMFILTSIRLFDDWGLTAADVSPRHYWNFTCGSYFETLTYIKWEYFHAKQQGNHMIMTPTPMDNLIEGSYNLGKDFELSTNMAGALTFNEYSECQIWPYDNIDSFNFDVSIIPTQLLGTLNSDYYNYLAYDYELVQNITVVETELPDNWLDWLGTVLDGFFGMEIFPNFTLGMVFIAVIAILFVFFVIKMIK